jgi:hypothetical protein
LNISFQTKALRSLAISQTLAARTLGEEVAEVFHALLADFDAARTPMELPLGFEESNESPIEFTVPLPNGYEAVFQSNHRHDRESARGTKMSWELVNRVKLMGVVKKND